MTTFEEHKSLENSFFFIVELLQGQCKELLGGNPGYA